MAIAYLYTHLSIVDNQTQDMSWPTTGKVVHLQSTLKKKVKILYFMCIFSCFGILYLYKPRDYKKLLVYIESVLTYPNEIPTFKGKYVNYLERICWYMEVSYKKCLWNSSYESQVSVQNYDWYSASTYCMFRHVHEESGYIRSQFEFRLRYTENHTNIQSLVYKKGEKCLLFYKLKLPPLCNTNHCNL